MLKWEVELRKEVEEREEKVRREVKMETKLVNKKGTGLEGR